MTNDISDDDATGHYRTAGTAVLAMAGVAFALGLAMSIFIGPNVGFIDGKSALMWAAIMATVGFTMRKG